MEYQPEQFYPIFLESAGISTDSRKTEKGSVFFALKGEKFDGNAYVSQVLDNGAGYAVCDDRRYSGSEDKRIVYVENVLVFLQQLARHHRRQFKIPVIAITGTNGKTTTKELVRSVLEKKYRVHCTRGNLNNHIGVPLTLLGMNSQTEIAIIEMGANHIGEIDELANIAEPDFGIVTNMGTAHIEGFGSEEGVRQTKSELYRYLNKHNGTIFVNTEEPHLSDYIPSGSRTNRYDSELIDSGGNPWKVKLNGLQPGLSVRFTGDDGIINHIESKLFGSYNFKNILAGIAVGKYFKVYPSDIAAAIDQYIPDSNRSQIVSYQGSEIILDAYNANPSSMRAAIASFAQRSEVEGKILILGDMFELGENSVKEHDSLIDFIQQFPWEYTALTGQMFNATSPYRANIHYFKTFDDLKHWFDLLPKEGKSIMIKGSRGMALERLLADGLKS